MSTFVRRLVSKKKRRFQEGDYDLDLAYVGPRIIAMGYPASGFESFYRNDFSTVRNFLDERHGDKYYVYNLCSERSYDPSVFDGRVERYPFDDHNPPQFDLIRQFCISASRWLGEDEENIAVVHCKAGKGRTGVMICALLLHNGSKPTAIEALQFYGQTRTFDEKGVTIPSQRHYVYYYELFLQSDFPRDVPFNPRPCRITRLRIDRCPGKWFTRSLQWKVQSMDGTISQTISVVPTKTHQGSVLDYDVAAAMPELTGDFKLVAFKGKKNAFYMWLNSEFVKDEEGFHKDIIDKASKDKDFSKDFVFTIYATH